MNKILIVIEREFFTRIRKKSFIVLTILMPLLIIGVMTVPVLLSSLDNGKCLTVALIDYTGKYLPILRDSGNIHIVPVGKMTDEVKEKDGIYTAVIVIDKDLNQDSLGATIYSYKEIPAEITTYFNKIISENIREERMSSYKIPQLEKIVSSCQVDYEVRTVKWTDTGGELLSDSKVAGLIGFVFTMLIYTFVMSYGGMVMQGVTEEKTNRIMEIMVSSVKPFQLMMGKIIGVALVGLFQFLIWGVLIGLGIIVFSSVMSGHIDSATNMATNMNNMSIPNSPNLEFLQILQGIDIGEILVMFVLYFIGGYLLYASFFAAVGASVNEQSDTSQFMMPIVILMLFALYAGIFSVENPDGPLAFWCSLFPLTSPVVMMIRIPFDVPWWQIILSLSLLFATACGVIWFSAKIYRVGILMYGKKPTMKEMVRWIRFK